MTGQRVWITIIRQVIPKIHPVMTDDRPLFRTLFKYMNVAQEFSSHLSVKFAKMFVFKHTETIDYVKK